MRRGTASRSGGPLSDDATAVPVTAAAPSASATALSAPVTEPAPVRRQLRTEFAFELPRGYVDESGAVHRDGVMRLATARDELILLRTCGCRRTRRTFPWCCWAG